MTVESVYHIAIKVPDLDRAIAFYEDHFGARLRERRHADESDRETAVDHAVLEAADKLVYLFDRAPYEAAGLVEEQPHGFLHYGFVVDDVDRYYETLSDDGVGVVMEPTRFGNLKMAFFTDPAGVRVELLEEL